MKQDIEQKDSDIFRLTKEVVELRVNKASLNSPEDRSNSSEAVTVRENATDDMKTPDSPTCTDFTDDAKTPFEKSVVDMQSSFAGDFVYNIFVFNFLNENKSIAALVKKSPWIK